MNDSMQPDGSGDDDRRLAALLASVTAEANPAVWARVRTRLAATPARRAGGRFDGFFDWLTRPAAMAAAVASLVVALGAGWSLLGTITERAATTTVKATEELVASDVTSFMESLLEASASGEAEDADTPEGDDAGDGAAPGDSGGQS